MGKGSTTGILIALGAAYILSQGNAQPIPKSNVTPDVAKQYSSSPPIQDILTTAPTAGQALTDLQNWYKTPLDPTLEGNPDNNPGENPLNVALLAAGVPLVAYQKNPAVSARAQIKTLTKNISSLQRELKVKLRKGRAGANSANALQNQIAGLQSRIHQIQGVLTRFNV